MVPARGTLPDYGIHYVRDDMTNFASKCIPPSGFKGESVPSIVAGIPCHRGGFFRTAGGAVIKCYPERIRLPMIDTIRKFASAAAMAGVLLLAGCGDEPKPAEAKKEVKKKPAIPEGNITALTAYYEVYKAARTLAPDLQTASIQAQEVDGVKSEEGKYSQWKIVFVSASTQTAWTFVYSTVEQGTILRGINNQGTARYGGARQDATPFSNSDFSVDSDAAYKAAAEKAKDFLAKTPKPVTIFALGNASTFPAPMWYILFGDAKSGGFKVYVNASTGVVFGK